MKVLGLMFRWKPKEGAVYSPHDSVHKITVGQKVYVTTSVISRSVKIIISGQTFLGSFSISKEICTIMLDSGEKRWIVTPLENVKFHKKVSHFKENGQNQYGTRFKYPVSQITYIAEIIDTKKMKEYKKEFSMRSNFEIMKMLFKDGIINSKEPDFIYKMHPNAKLVDFSRIEGMLLGIAIGDSLGNTSESMTPEERRKVYGLITDYLPNRHAHNKKIGLPSDDTQLAFDTLEVILDKERLDMEELARTFSSHRIFGIGATVKEFLRNYKKYGKPWYLSGVDSAGNGALMRIAPVIISGLRNRNENIWSDTILDTMLTHNNPIAIGSSIAFVNMLLKFISSRNLPNTDLLIEEFTNILAMFAGNEKANIRNAKIGLKFHGSATDFIKRAIKFGYEKGLTVEEFGNYFGSGAYVLETDAISLYILSKYLNNPQEALLQAVNYTKDNDTTASIVGAALGALYGTKAFKETWISGLSGRIRERDDGKIFEMISKTKEFLELNK